MSAETIVSASPSSARMNEIPDGPPVPVTSTRPCSSGTPSVLDGTADRLGGGRGSCRSGVSLAHHLERFDVAAAGEPGPGARRRPQELLVEVGALVDLGGDS